MKEAYRLTRKDGAPGIDGVTAADYATNLEVNLLDLLDRIKSGRYKAPPVRRNGESVPRSPRGARRRRRPPFAAPGAGTAPVAPRGAFFGLSRPREPRRTGRWGRR